MAYGMVAEAKSSSKPKGEKKLKMMNIELGGDGGKKPFEAGGGGVHVEHLFHRSGDYGIGMDHPAEHYNFGEIQGNDFTGHIAEHLGLSGDKSKGAKEGLDGKKAKVREPKGGTPKGEEEPGQDEE
jgi:hypothetical protein